jgi:hypothetical protein
VLFFQAGTAVQMQTGGGLGAKDSSQPEFLIKLYRQTAIRYVLMAEDVEKCPERLGSFYRQDRRSLWARARVFTEPA